MNQFRVGDTVQAGEPGSDEWDHGTVKKVDQTKGILVVWEIAEDEIWEDESELENY